MIMSAFKRNKNLQTLRILWLTIKEDVVGKDLILNGNSVNSHTFADTFLNYNLQNKSQSTSRINDFTITQICKCTPHYCGENLTHISFVCHYHHRPRNTTECEIILTTK